MGDIIILIYFLIAISLSVDAFSIALVIGTTNHNKKVLYIQPLLIGLFHYLMPILGSLLSSLVINKLLRQANLIISLVFLILSFEIYKSKDEQKIVCVENLFLMIFIAITVSIDSLLVGLVLSLKQINIYQASLVFSIVSCLVTFLGIKIGTRLRSKYQNYAKYLGIVILLVLALKYLMS